LSCKGKCSFVENGYFGYPKYSLGYKYCTKCNFSLIVDGSVCPCCNSSLRSFLRHKKRNIFIENIVINENKKLTLNSSNE